MIEEARHAGLTVDRVIVLGEFATYAGEGIRFQRFEDSQFHALDRKIRQVLSFEDWSAAIEREVGAEVEAESYRQYYDRGLSPAEAVLQDRLDNGVIEKAPAA
ncbi:hypothetical protein [Paraburkholderia sp. SIMBA_054]|uniref:hypothetical protein n=1 Tax=Paraburkholderia sp. SIMBA_054 TaxID=3085795 RepID=UPI00397C03A9